MSAQTLMAFAGGQPVGVAEVTANRDRRVARQRAMAASAPGETIVVVAMNIPGPVKRSEALEWVFDAFLRRVDASLERLGHLRDEGVLRADTGCEAFRLVDAPAEAVKKTTMTVEDSGPIGRLFDVDVLRTDAGRPGWCEGLTRASVGVAGRTCLICGGPVRECARSRRHGLDALTRAIDDLVRRAS